MKPVLTKAAIAAALLSIPLPAFAWKHNNQAWCDPDPPPVEYYVSDYVEDSVPEGYPKDVIQEAYDVWQNEAPCAGVGGVYQGVSENSPYVFDYENRHTFDDPADSLAAGILAATLTLPQGGGSVCFAQEGSLYYRILDSDIVWNDNVDFATEDEIPQECAGETSMKGVAVHEIGHQFGLGHSCDQGEPCNDQDLREATMYWTGGACDKSQSDLGVDDIEGINAIYGPYASVVCSHELDPEDPDTIAFGITPFTILCRVESKSRGEIANTIWRWGDGAVTEGPAELDVAHQYTEPGNYTLTVEIQGNNEECGDWNYTARRIGYVRACGIPEAQFTYRHENGLTYDFLNETDVSVYGCIYDIQWDVFTEGGTEPIATLKAWEPKFTFPDEGTYRVVLNIGGPAGTGAAELLIEAENSRGEGYGGCNTAGLGGLGGVGLAVAGLLGLRRRRK